MDIRKLQYFIAVAEELHFNRAAEKLHMTQPPLSQQIKALEKELGVQLLERNKKTVRITPAGAVFLEEAKRILAQLERSIKTTQLAGQGIIGHLNIGFVDSAAGGLMVDILKLFRERFPQIQLNLREMTSAQQSEALHDGSIHIGFMRFVEQSGHFNNVTITNESLVAVLPENHPLSAQSEVSVSLLHTEPFIMFPRQQGLPFYDLIMEFCAQHGLHPNVVQEAIQMYTIVNLVAANLGVSIVPSSASVFQRSSVVFRPIKEATPSIPLHTVWRTDCENPIVTTFLEAVHEVISTNIKHES